MFFPLFDEYRYLLEIVIASYLFLFFSCERKTMFYYRFFISLIILLLLPILYIYGIRVFIQSNQIIGNVFVINLVWYIFVVFMICVHLFLSFKINLSTILWTTIFSFSFQHMVYCIADELLIMGIFVEQAKSNFALYALINIGVYAVLCVAIYFIFRKFIIRKDIHPADTLKGRILYSAVLVFLIAISFLNQFNAIASFTSLNYIAVFSDIALCLSILAFQYISLYNNSIIVEKNTLAIINKLNKEAYEQFKQNNEYLSLKIHDFKHEVAKYQDLKSVSIDEVKAAIEERESFVSSGNSVLDAILLEKNNLFVQHDIAFSCLCDAEELRLMNEYDIYSLFNNILDNAFEHCLSLPKDKRFITFKIRKHESLLLIYEENYLKGDLKMENGLPITHHRNKSIHGFGTKSIRYIVKKYNGSLTFSSKNNTFNINICFPLD